jgi:3,4-dihydroxy 2-butanone 4-phosphate synthase / GTP cyclohydrolase II
MALSSHRVMGSATPYTKGVASTTVNLLSRGGLIVLAEARGRGHGIVAGIAASLTAQHATFMAIRARGLLSVTVGQETAFRLGLQRMPISSPDTGRSTEFLVSIEASECQGSGISAHDRALTIRCAGRPESTHHDVIMPGHIVPLLVAQPARAEASLAEIAHLIVTERCGFPVAVWCDILNDDGDVASFHECGVFAQDFGLGFVDAACVRDAMLKEAGGREAQTSLGRGSVSLRNQRPRPRP